LVLLFGLLILMLATLQHYLADIRINAHKRHLNIPSIRSPGESTRRRIDRTTGEIGAFAVALGTIPLALYAALLSYAHFLYRDLGWMDTVYFGAISAAFMLYGSNKINRLKARKRRLFFTYEGQMAVAQEVNRLLPEGYRVYHDFPTDRFHIDHIIIGPAGVFTVTTKVIAPTGNKRGAALTVDGQRLLLGKNAKDDRTVPYAAFQATWLAKWLLTATGEALPVRSVLTIPGWRIRILKQSTVLVIEPAVIGDVMGRFSGNRLTGKTIRTVCEQIEAKCQIAPPS